MRYYISQYWKIAVGLVSIFIGGLGFGGVLESMRQRHSEQQIEVASDHVDWISSTLTSLDRSLSLTDTQKERLRPKIESAAREIELSRESALLKFEISLLKLHRSIASELNPSQLKELRKSERKLEDRIQQRSEALLQEEPDPGAPVDQ